MATNLNVGERVELMVTDHSIPGITQATVISIDNDEHYPVLLRLDEPHQYGHEYRALPHELTRLDHDQQDVSWLAR